jgi:glycolate oxidase
VATNSGGPHTLKYGVTTNHVLGFEMVLPDGEAVWLGTKPDGGEDVDGYDLRGAVIGCEGMFGVVTQVLVKLVRAPQAYKTLLGIFESVDDASQTVSDIIAAGIIPGAMEMMDQLITQAVESTYHFGFPLDAGAVLIVELDGLAAGLDRQAGRILEICRTNRAREIRVAKDDEERALIWKCRKRAFGAIGRLSPNFLTQDGVVPRSKLPEIMRFIPWIFFEIGVSLLLIFIREQAEITDSGAPFTMRYLFRPSMTTWPILLLTKSNGIAWSLVNRDTSIFLASPPFRIATSIGLPFT